MNNEKLEEIRNFIIDKVIMDQRIMFSDDCRGEDTGVDLPEVIASLYEVLHREATGEEYSYMFHWANKVGSYVDDKLFIDKWVPVGYDGYADSNPVYEYWECSKCGYEHMGDEETLTTYCPNCGAKMR